MDEREEFSKPQRFISGVRAVEEMLKRKPGLVHRVLFMLKSGNAKLYELQKFAERVNVHVQQVDEKYLDKFTKRHNGVIALCHEKAMMPWNEMRQILMEIKKNDIPCRVVVAANIEDPHNLGACIRSSFALGVNIMLLPSKGSCGLTPAVERSAAGSLEKMTLCRPGNLEFALSELKEAGYQIVGLDGHSETLITEFEFSRHLVMAIGGEDKGLPPYIKKFCNSIVKIPMAAEAHSYNASVALSLGLYTATFSIFTNK